MRTRTTRTTTTFISLLAIASLSAAACGAGSGTQDDGSWEPERNVEIIAGADPGGGFDRTARAIKSALEEKGSIDTNISVQNRPGAGGSVGWTYMNTHESDGHYLSLSSPSLPSGNLTGNSDLSYKDMTPISMMLEEYIAFAVRADSPIETGSDFIRRVEDDPESVTVGIATTLGNHNHVATALPLREAGVSAEGLRSVRTPVFDSGGKALNALLSGAIDVLPAPTSNVVEQMRAGKVRIIAVSSPERLGGAMQDVPTWEEQGIEGATFNNWLGVVGPKGLGDSEIQYWQDKMSDVTKTHAWQKAAEENYWETNYMDSQKTTQFMKNQREELESILTDLGLVE